MAANVANLLQILGQAGWLGDVDPMRKRQWDAPDTTTPIPAKSTVSPSGLPPRPFEFDGQPVGVVPNDDSDPNNGAAANVPVANDPYSIAKQRYEQALSSPVDKSKGWQNILVKLAAVANNVFNPQHQMPVEGWGEVKHDQRVEDAAKVFGPLQQLADVETKRKLVAAQTADVLAKPGDRNAAATDRGTRTGILQTNVQRKQLDDFRKNNPIFDAANPTPGQVTQLQAAGATPDDIGSYDLSKTPPLKKFGKQVFEYSAKDHVWNLTDIDPTSNDPLEPYEVTDSDGSKETLNIPSSRKAALLTALQTAGMRVKAQKDIANINQAGQTERTRVTNKGQAAKVLAAIDNGPPLQGETPEQTAQRKASARAQFLADNP